MPNRDKTVFAAMSGGVDSSVAAMLLARRGYNVIGIFIRSYNLDGCAERDAEDARRVAEKLRIPFYVWDFEEEYKKRVVDYMIEGYRRGITPNPDVVCNREIKFGLFFDKAMGMGVDFVATGHYVRLRRKFEIRKQSESNPKTESFALFSAKDKNKDQSYFLWTMTQNHLRHCIFPIGNYLKTEVREIARKAGLPTADKKDSQGICFLGKVSLADFLKRYIPEKRGEILTVSGKAIGTHAGAHFYTIGQRHGLNLSQKQKALGIRGRVEARPYYVAAKDVKKNLVIVAEGGDGNLSRSEIKLSDLNFTYLRHPRVSGDESISVMARLRYRQTLAGAKLIIKSGSHARMVFDRPQKFVAAGQSAVFYSKIGKLIGGGIIG